MYAGDKTEKTAIMQICVYRIPRISDTACTPNPQLNASCAITPVRPDKSLLCNERNAEYDVIVLRVAYFADRRHAATDHAWRVKFDPTSDRFPLILPHCAVSAGVGIGHQVTLAAQHSPVLMQCQ